MPPARPRSLEVTALRRRERAIDLEVEQVVIAEDRVERRADLVADRGEESTLRRVRGDGVGARHLRGGRGCLKQRVRGASRRQVARHFREPEQLALLVPKRGEGD